ncbi:hypothetical protein LZ30DRAFT_254215 [Colletotrichum cereale]|nr:hypothetical protein LZ30DRAFT_254215 [Colletotrichum cereale]
MTTEYVIFGLPGRGLFFSSSFFLCSSVAGTQPDNAISKGLMLLDNLHSGVRSMLGIKSPPSRGTTVQSTAVYLPGTMRTCARVGEVRSYGTRHEEASDERNS